MHSNSSGLEDHVIRNLARAINELRELTEEIDDNISKGAAKNEVSYLQDVFFSGFILRD